MARSGHPSATMPGSTWLAKAMRPAGERQSVARALHQTSRQNELRAERQHKWHGRSSTQSVEIAHAILTSSETYRARVRPALYSWVPTRASACHIAILVLHAAVRRVFQDIRAKSLNNGHCKKNQQIALPSKDTVRMTGSKRGSRLSQQVVFAAGAFAAKRTSKQRLLPQAPGLRLRLGGWGAHVLLLSLHEADHLQSLCSAAKPPS